jgi:hypothetical protein
MFREEFIKRVEEAEKNAMAGKSKHYTYDEFKKEFLHGGMMKPPYDIEVVDKLKDIGRLERRDKTVFIMP